MITQEILFGEWVACRRQERGLTKTECARRAGISAQRWAQIEQATYRRRDKTPVRPERSTVQAVAYALGVPLQEALRAAGYPPDFDKEEQPAVITYYKELPAEVQVDVLEMVRALYRRYRQSQAITGPHTGS